MKKSSLFVFAASIALLAAAAYAADAPKAAAPKLDGIKCPVSGKDAKAEEAVDHHGGKVYLCCPGCKDGLKEHAAAANAQLVATGQATQKACPLTGKATKEAQTVEVAGVKVALCCGNCKGAVSKLEGDAKVAKVFSDDAFTKGFEVKK